jgi:hypothetical protein
MISEGAGGFNPLKESLSDAFRHGLSPLFSEISDKVDVLKGHDFSRAAMATK